MKVEASIFKAYDIRGVIDETLNEQVAFHIGKAFGSAALQAEEKTVAVGRDGRLSGAVLLAALVEGLTSTGINVINVGAVTSPMLYFAATKYCQSGIQVTGSHNPKNYNGLKMVLAGQTIYGNTIQDLYHRIIEEDYVLADVAGEVTALDIFSAYQQAIIDSVQLSRKIKVVVDCGNGITGTSSPAILKALGCDVVAELFTEVDGNFSNHHPDPSKPENLEDLRRAVKENGAELGLAFDGDGDRLGVVTADGQEIFPDRQLILFARDVLSRCPGAPIIFDVKCTQQMIPAIKEAGGVPYMSTTGHSLVKAKMNELNSPLGGEMSGHIFFKERWFGFDDATYSAARLLEILSCSDNPSAVLNALPTSFSTPELNISCPENNAHELVRQLVQVVQAVLEFKEGGAAISTMDGVRVDWPDGFGLIRASNTTPILVLRFEGQTPQALKRIQRLMMQMLQKVIPDVQMPV